VARSSRARSRRTVAERMPPLYGRAHSSSRQRALRWLQGLKLGLDLPT
jgi:hypothetical protein